MRFDSVTAHAFGPFVDQTLDLAPGMTIVYGPNESGKSRWHAALYAGLCGMRRGRGRPMKEDEVFEDRHRPLNGDAWEVSAIISLEDGRRVKLHQDLVGKTGTAHDVDSGRDYTSEIIKDGAPDGAVWLGLDRRSFLSTACVKQADIQSIMNDAETLQEQMQRAAATAGKDATAAAALTAIEEFHRDNVGLNRSNSTKPLRTATVRLNDARARLKEASKAHANYVAQLAELEALEVKAAKAECKRRIVEVAIARKAADDARRSLDRADELKARHPHDPAPEHSRQGSLAQRARLALQGWNNRPAPVDLTGPGAKELQCQLDGLPPTSEGDTEPHSTVVDARDDFNHARDSLRDHRARRPAEPSPVDTGGLTSEEIGALIPELSLEEPQVNPRLQERVDRAQAESAHLEEQEARQPTGPFAWLFRLIAAILALFRGKGEDDSHARLRAEKELAEAKEALGEVQFEVANIRQRKTAAARRGTAHGLPVDPEALGTLAERLDKASEAERDLHNWHGHETILQENVDRAEQALAEALRARGSTDARTVAGALAAYEAACNERAKQNREAGRRPDLERALAARLEAETAAKNNEKRRNDAVDDLRQSAGVLGLGDCDDEMVAARLCDWIKAYDAAAPDRRRAAYEWIELRNLLGEGGIEDLERAAEERRNAAEAAAQGLDEGAINSVVLEPDSGAQLQRLRKLESERKQALNTAQGELREVARNLSNVAEAEEELERAEAEHARVTNLGDILSKTRQFLQQAQEEAHRDIAPHLVKALTPWIKKVTGGRYSTVMVDPQDLMVRVSSDGGELRDAPLLSHGTTEQIYLLLRVAMAGLLTRASGETCPLLLDDVTVHCDSERQTAILNLLQEISRERQVILFSQEPETLSWAERHLRRDIDRLIKLDPGEIGV